MAIDPLSRPPAAASPCSLLCRRRLAPLFVTLCLGTWATVLLARLGWTSLGESPASALYVLPLLPLVLCTASAGQLADRYDKTILIRLGKLLETLIVALATFALVRGNPAALAVALALLGLLAVLSAPVNYALLAQQLDADERVDGNALLAAGRYLAVLGAALTAALLAGAQAGAVPSAWIGVALSVASLLASLAIGRAPAPAPGLVASRNPAAAIRHIIAAASQSPSLVLAIIGSAWCWLCAALALAQLPGYWHASWTLSTAPLAALTLGGAVGALLCARISGRRLEIGVLPITALGIAGCALALILALPEAASGIADEAAGRWPLLFALGALGTCCGLLLVALNVLLQSAGAARQRGRVVAVSSLLNALAIACGGLISVLWPASPRTLTWLLAGAALGFVALAAGAYRQAPHRSLRFLTELLIHAFYKLGKRGFEHIPQSGPAVLVFNHVSFVDSVVIMAAVRRPIRFVIDHRIYETPLANTLFRHSRTIPIATAKESPQQKEAAFAEVALALRDGELIGLFPEGGITRNGEINHFRYGVGRIVAETPVPVIPMALRGLWGSFYSRRDGPAMSKPSLLRLRAPIELVAGPAVPAPLVTPEYLQQLVGQLRGDWR